MGEMFSTAVDLLLFRSAKNYFRLKERINQGKTQHVYFQYPGFNKVWSLSEDVE